MIFISLVTKTMIVWIIKNNMVKRREKELWACGLGNFQIYIYIVCMYILICLQARMFTKALKFHSALSYPL